MNITVDQMKSLDYSGIHAAFILKHSQKPDGKLCYEPAFISKQCAFLRSSETHVVPCYQRVKTLPNGVQFTDYFYATMRVPLGYGTYDIAPMMLSTSLIGKFVKQDCACIKFEGFFYSKMQLVNAFKHGLLKDLQALRARDSFIDDIVMAKASKIKL